MGKSESIRSDSKRDMKLFGALLVAARADPSVTCNNENDEVVMRAKVPVGDVQKDLSLLADWSLDDASENYVAEWTSFTGTGFTIEQAERTKLSDSTKYQALVITKTIESDGCTKALVDGVNVCIKTGYDLDFECAYDLSDQELDTVDFTVAGSDVANSAVGEGTLTYTLEVNSGLKIGETAPATITPKTAGLVEATVESCTVQHDDDSNAGTDDSSVNLFDSNEIPDPNPLGVTFGDVKGNGVLDFNWASFKWTTQKKEGQDVVETQSLKCNISLRLPGPTTSTMNANVLYLNTYLRSHVPKLINLDGDLPTTFRFNGAYVTHSCSVTLENNHYIFGGQHNMRQILQVDNCGLTNIGSLPFDFYYGACDKANNGFVLCFASTQPNTCRKSLSPTGPWTEMAPTKHGYAYNAIAGSPDTVLTVGRINSAEYTGDKTTELYDFDDDSWSEGAKYPFGDPEHNFLGWHSMLYVDELESFFVVGGRGHTVGMQNHVVTAQIAKFKDGVWSDAGQLNRPRMGTSAFWLNGSLLVIGGYDRNETPTEKCTMNSQTDMFECTDMSPALARHGEGHALVVPIDYCLA